MSFERQKECKTKMRGKFSHDLKDILIFVLIFIIFILIHWMQATSCLKEERIQRSMD